MTKSKTSRQQTSASGKAKGAKNQGGQAARIKKGSAVKALKVVKTRQMPAVETQAESLTKEIVASATSTATEGAAPAPASPEATTPLESLSGEAAATLPLGQTESAAPSSPKKAKRKKAAKEIGPHKLSALDAAVKVLAEAGTPMNTKAMIEAMDAKDYWTSPGGQTPAATLYSALLREISTKGEQARFTKTARGHFGLRQASQED